MIRAVTVGQTHQHQHQFYNYNLITVNWLVNGRLTAIHWWTLGAVYSIIGPIQIFKLLTGEKYSFWDEDFSLVSILTSLVNIPISYCLMLVSIFGHLMSQMFVFSVITEVSYWCVFACAVVGKRIVLCMEFSMDLLVLLRWGAYTNIAALLGSV